MSHTRRQHSHKNQEVERLVVRVLVNFNQKHFYNCRNLYVAIQRKQIDTIKVVQCGSKTYIGNRINNCETLMNAN